MMSSVFKNNDQSLIIYLPPALPFKNLNEIPDIIFFVRCIKKFRYFHLNTIQNIIFEEHPQFGNPEIYGTTHF